MFGLFVTRSLFLSTVITALAVALSMLSEARHAIPYLDRVHTVVFEIWLLLRPGGHLHPAVFIENHGHLVLEGSLIIIILYLLFQSSSKPSKTKALKGLTSKEVQELCDEWQPEPLVGGNLTPFQQAWVLNSPLVVSPILESNNNVLVNGKKEALDFASMNFLGLAGHPEISAAAHATISRIGVGSCGPRGFYGTLDVHLEFEDALSKFAGTQEAILYSYDLATLPSIIPAFANRKDLIVADEGCSYTIRNGCCLSRARVIYFKHNDMEDLERILKQIAGEDRRHPRPLNRRFVVVEGIYVNTGEVAPLARIVDLKNKYKYRLIVDDSVGIGVMGGNGRGSIEAAGLRPEDVEILGASLGNALATIGGFCAGDREIVDHQRLSGAGYCFSASLPPYLASAGIKALDILSSEGADRAAKVRNNARRFRLAASEIPRLSVVGGSESLECPLVHLTLTECSDYDQGDMLLQKLVEYILDKSSVLFTVSKYSILDQDVRPPPSIKVALSALHTVQDIDKAIAALNSASLKLL